MNGRAFVRLAVCVALCGAIAAVGGLATAPQIPVWYAGLAKPAWTPPNAAFPIAWSLLYALIAIALYLLWDRTAATPARARALRWFALQLALNAAWSPVFFALHAPRAGLAIILLLLGSIAATIRSAWPVHRTAALLLVPYVLWVAYAASLDAGIVALNPA